MLTPLDGTPPPQYVMGRTRNREPFAVLSVGGTTFTQRLARIGGQVTTLGRPYSRIELIADGGTSDVIAGSTPAQIITALTNYVAAARSAGAARVTVLTCPKSTLITAGALETARAAYNALLLSSYASLGIDQVIDIAPLFPDPTDTTLISDGTHYTQAGANLVGAAMATAGV